MAEENRMIRRRRAWLAGIGALALLVSACGADGNGETGDPATDPGEGNGEEQAAESDGPITLEIAANAIRGGKNDVEAEWIEDYVIPTFEQMMADEGKDVTVEFTGRGVDDENFKAQIALDLASGTGADIINIDGIWVGEFVTAGYLEPLQEVVGPEADDWEGWDQIPEAVQANMAFEDQRYGIPAGTDGRVLYFNRDLFEQAGLPADWQPTSWDEILETAETLRAELPDVTPLQINAGTAMGEATTMQGFLPLLAGTGARVYDEDGGQWLGDTEELRETLQFYADVYEGGLGDVDLQIQGDGRDRSFEAFANGQIAILAEGDYFWRGVVNPDGGVAPMDDRDEVVGYALIPAREPGAGVNGQDFVSMSGGSGRVLNPGTAHPTEAWQLLTFMNSEEAVLAFVEDEPRVTQRSDVNDATLADDEHLSFVSSEVLPITLYRPGFAEYPEVSALLQAATETVVTGGSPEESAASYRSALESVVGADAISGD
jgi:multiple sugar transport system substrate-binding protein